MTLEQKMMSQCHFVKNVLIISSQVLQHKRAQKFEASFINDVDIDHHVHRLVQVLD